MYKIYFVALLAALATAQQTPVTLDKSQNSVLVQALASVYNSVRNDPAWSSIYSIMTTATGKEGAAATFVRNQGDRPIITASSDFSAAMASAQSKYSSIVTELPSEVYAAYASVASIRSDILASVYSAVSAEASLTASGTTATATATSTPTSSAVQSISSLVAATTSPAVVLTGGAERVKQLGCVAAIGVLGAGAVLL